MSETIKKHKHSIYDTDPHFIIDPISMAITTDAKKTTLIKGSHNCERFTFEMPKEIEDWRENWLLSMINAMDREVSLEESDKVLILMQLNTKRGNHWFSNVNIAEKVSPYALERMTRIYRPKISGISL